MFRQGGPAPAPGRGSWCGSVQLQTQQPGQLLQPLRGGGRRAGDGASPLQPRARHPGVREQVRVREPREGGQDHRHLLRAPPPPRLLHN